MARQECGLVLTILVECVSLIEARYINDWVPEIEDRQALLWFSELRSDQAESRIPRNISQSASFELIEPTITPVGYLSPRTVLCTKRLSLGTALSQIAVADPPQIQLRPRRSRQLQLALKAAAVADAIKKDAAVSISCSEVEACSLHKFPDSPDPFERLCSRSYLGPTRGPCMPPYDDDGFNFSKVPLLLDKYLKVKTDSSKKGRKKKRRKAKKPPPNESTSEYCNRRFTELTILQVYARIFAF
jgi:hypothetical protein